MNAKKQSVSSSTIINDKKVQVVGKLKRMRGSAFGDMPDFLGDDRPNKRRKKQVFSGFTLIEVLVVIGIIAILAAVVLVAVNPSRQFKLARDSQRVSNVNALLNGIHQNMAEHRGNFVCAGATRAIPTIARLVQSASTSPETEGDIAGCLIPDYLSSLPFDPSIVGAHYSSTADYNTGYVIYRDSDNRITASSTGELTSSISVTR